MKEQINKWFNSLFNISFSEKDLEIIEGWFEQIFYKKLYKKLLLIKQGELNLDEYIDKVYKKGFADEIEKDKQRVLDYLKGKEDVAEFFIFDNCNVSRNFIREMEELKCTLGIIDENYNFHDVKFCEEDNCYYEQTKGKEVKNGIIHFYTIK